MLLQLQRVTDHFDLPDCGQVPVCRWRKYGEKFLVGSCAPRLYFKCSHKACQAKKHVQVGLILMQNSTCYAGLIHAPVNQPV